MSLSLKDKILELADIAKACPENLQERCFVLLLEDFLASRVESRDPKPKRDSSSADATKTEVGQETKVDEQKSSEANTQEDFAEKDIHVKVRKFLKDRA